MGQLYVTVFNRLSLIADSKWVIRECLLYIKLLARTARDKQYHKAQADLEFNLQQNNLRRILIRTKSQNARYKYRVRDPVNKPWRLYTPRVVDTK